MNDGRRRKGVAGLRVGLVQEGFARAEAEVRDLVMAAADVLARAGAKVSEVSVPEHHQTRAAQRPHVCLAQP